MAAGVTDWRVRRAELDDAPTLARTNVAAWRSAYAGIVPDEHLAGMDPLARAETWREYLSAGDPYATFVAVDAQDAIAAYCTVGVLRTVDGKGEPSAGELMAIYADPARKGTGAGRAVHDSGLDHLIQHGFEWAGLWVFTANSAARAFYAAQGWTPDGETHEFELAGKVISEMRYTRRLLAATKG
ncbi:MAG TPA: GNAT family N-acetyltransferase [Pseudonocardiaceae bacterium]|jgi:GNAT superfamily N-acetyltransferase|nr:GNAT family N-acetyltransferase [Pseudonocardiaceae bacterium]